MTTNVHVQYYEVDESEGGGGTITTTMNVDVLGGVGEGCGGGDNDFYQVHFDRC